MELIMVNSVKLKIILTPQDMQEMDISNDTLDYDSAKTRGALRSILERARLETGFDTRRDKIYVQVFPSNDGGCEMFLTRRGKLLPEPGDSEKTYLKKKYRLLGDDRHERKEYIAASSDIDNIVDLCVRMNREGFGGSSGLYSLGKEFVLLICFSRRMPSFAKNTSFKDGEFDDDADRFSFMSDYADLFFAEKAMLARLNEHGTLLIEKNAVETLANTFSET